MSCNECSQILSQKSVEIKEMREELIDAYGELLVNCGVLIKADTTRHSRYIGWYSLEESVALVVIARRLVELGAWESHPMDKCYARPIQDTQISPTNFKEQE